ncbi:MAG: hypothetical protein ACYC2U_00355 [Candidatus Amoebophilus sp.]
MYTTKRSQKYSHQYLLYLLGKFIALILILNASKCQCKSGSPDAVGSLKIAAESKLLVGNDQRQINITFSIGDSENPVELEDFKLRASIVEQNTFSGTTTGTTVTYTSNTEGNKAFSDTQPLEEPLTEISPSLIKLEPGHAKGFPADFNLVPDKDAIEVKLKFELLNEAKQVIDHVEVRWIKSEFAINLPKEFSGSTSYFSLKPLKEDITDLSKYKMDIVSNTDGVDFSFVNTVNTKTPNQASLTELLGNISKLYQNQDNTILVHINGKGKGTAKFTISISPNDAKSNSDPLGKIDGDWIEHNSGAGVSQEENKLGQTKNKQFADNKELEELKEQKKQLDQQKKEIEKQFKKEKKKPLKQEQNKALHELKNKKGELGSKYKEEQEKILQGFAQRLTDAENKDLKPALERIQAALEENAAKRSELKTKLKEDKQEEKGTKKDLGQAIKKNKEKEAKLSSPKLILIPGNNLRSESHSNIYINFNNLGRELTEEDLKSLTIWYEIKNSIGNTSQVTIKGKKYSDKGNKQQGFEMKPGRDKAINLASFFRKIKVDGVGKIILKMEGNDSTTESMQFVIHLEGLADKVPACKVSWNKPKLPK